MSKREAAGLLHQARELAEHPEVAQAAAAGRISVGQAKAIGTVLGGLDELDEPQQAQAEQLLLEHGGQHGHATGWRKLPRRCWRRSPRQHG